MNTISDTGRSGAKRAVIVTSHEWPAPPLFGAHRKIHDVILALKDEFAVHLVVYSPEKDAAQALQEYWDGRVCVNVLRPKDRFSSLRAVTKGTLRTVEMRRFDAELALVRGITAGSGGAVLLIDGLSGLPILRHFGGATICSLHDAMSDYFRIQKESARHGKEHLLWWLRERAALRLERRFLHRVRTVHMVTEEDAARIRSVNPRARTVVIPVLGRLPAAGVGGGPGLPGSSNGRVLLWGNIALGPVREGMRRLVSSRVWGEAAGKLDVWCLGRAKESVFRAHFPVIGRNVGYVDIAEDLPAFLSTFNAVVIPDLEGRGQKQRAFEALRLGLCVAGFPEAFRGLPRAVEPYFLERNTADELLEDLMSTLTEGRARAMGERARVVMETDLGFEGFRNAWLDLVLRNAS